MAKQGREGVAGVRDLEEEEEEGEDEWAAKEAALDGAERIQAGRRVTSIQQAENTQKVTSWNVGNNREDGNI